MNHALSVFRRYFRRSSESGQSVILLALGFVALAGFVGITTDISLMFVRYAQLSRAVDSAAIAAANQMRQDRSNATVQLAARQFIEFYGISPESVIVDTCLTTEFKDADLCTNDQAKLVRVRAYFRQPTVFLRLLGVQSFDMWVAATSQTAALDVVIVMDVSESMANQTTYGDWALTEKMGADADTTVVKTTNYGVIYRPPLADEILNDKLGLNPDGSSKATASDITGFWQSWQPGTNVLPGLLNRAQIDVNSYFTYYNGKNSTTGYDDENKKVTSDGSTKLASYNGPAIPQFGVEYVDNFFNDTNFPGRGYSKGLDPSTGKSIQPRDACRVRFYPPASQADSTTFKTVKNDDGKFMGYNSLLAHPKVDLSPLSSNRFFDGFVPTYNYYGCCNDPDGLGGFDDLVCQPFKQVRAATFGFLDRIDFLRGDRAAFVTYNRTAFLVNPYRYLTGADGDEEKRAGAMLDNKNDAYSTLKHLIGVHAEPYFYLMTQPGTSTGNNPRELVTEWTKQSIGFDDDGKPVSLDFGKTPYNASITVGNPEAINYPVYNNCPIQNAKLDSTRTLFPNGLANASLPSEIPVQSAELKSNGGKYIPNEFGIDTAWLNQSNAGKGDWLAGSTNGREAIISGTGAARVYNPDGSYEAWAACRNGNIGAALREANNALLNPNTSRRFGTIWIIVLMSDGGAGASDPVRRNGEKLAEFQPYVANKDSKGVITSYGKRGQYGAFGLCPIGTPDEPGELITYDNDTVVEAAAKPPFCADEDPISRHTCDFRPLLTLPSHPSYGIYNTATESPLQDADYRDAGEQRPGDVSSPEDYPPKTYTPAQLERWNKDRDNFYDVDIGPKGPNYDVKVCDPLYDVEDYARDWADYIAIANLGTASANTQVPTIFTIGFNLEFIVRADPKTPDTHYFNEDLPLNDPSNAVKAQEMVMQVCSWNVDRCLGEQLLRYIADIGDNNRIDNDYYQDLMGEWYDFGFGREPGSVLVADGVIFNSSGKRLSFGARDACQTQDQPGEPVGPVDEAYDYNKNGKIQDVGQVTENGVIVMKRTSDGDELTNEWGQLRANVSCGNYYYSPNADQLQFIFDDIASRMFTRLAR